jgi:hypothetical protein
MEEGRVRERGERKGEGEGREGVMKVKEKVRIEFDGTLPSPQGQQRGRMKASLCRHCCLPVVSQPHGVCLIQSGEREGRDRISERKEVREGRGRRKKVVE